MSWIKAKSGEEFQHRGHRAHRAEKKSEELNHMGLPLGWKCNFIVACQAGAEYFGTFPQHDPQKLAELLKSMGRSDHEPRESVSLIDGMYDHGFCIGAFPRGAMVCDFDLTMSCLPVEAATPKVVSDLLAVYPGARVMAFSLHSVVDAFAFAYFVNGKRVRTLEGCADAGTTIDFGQPLDVEQPWVGKAEIRNGKRIYKVAEDDGEVMEWGDEIHGEELVFAAGRLMFDSRLDEFELERLEVRRFVKPGWWRRFWNRRSQR